MNKYTVLLQGNLTGRLMKASVWAADEATMRAKVRADYPNHTALRYWTHNPQSKVA